MSTELTIRRAVPSDHDDIWAMLKPVFRSGTTYAIDPDIPEAEALAYWTAEHCFVALDGQQPLGTFYIRRNQRGGGSHVCNAGFVTAPAAQGRGIARAMLAQALVEAKQAGFEAMQFNFVLADNSRAIATWQRAGFREIGRIPHAFKTPHSGYVDALILHKFLE